MFSCLSIGANINVLQVIDAERLLLLFFFFYSTVTFTFAIFSKEQINPMAALIFCLAEDFTPKARDAENFLKIGKTDANRGNQTK